MADDAYINFRVVDNLVNGHGPVFNVGERVEVYTDPLWVAVLSVFRVIFGAAALPWCAVVIGLGCSVAGVVLGSRAAQRVGSWHFGGIVVPVGLLTVGALDATWDFATSGLETGAVFGWEGLSWWLLVRAADRKRGAPLVAFVCGLGVLLRPDLALVSVPFLVALGLLVRSPAWMGPRALWRGWLLPLMCAGGLPVVYEVFRMGYFALLVPNTALAKSAGSADWSRGVSYLTDLANPTWLWVPLVAAVVGVAVHTGAVRRSRGGVMAAILAAPAAGGILQWLYIVRIGGDYMHGRMLLPGLFLLSMSLYCQLRGRLELTLATACSLWALSIATAYRYPIHAGHFGAQTQVDNERMFWAADAQTPHPVSLSDYAKSPFRQAGQQLQELAASAPAPGSGRYVIVSPAAFPTPGVPLKVVQGKGTLAVRVVAPEGSIGLVGVGAGPEAYIFDLDSLANPIGSHSAVTQRNRAGHEKVTPATWMYGRFASPGEALPAEIDPAQAADARAALACGPLASYLHEITRSFTGGSFLTGLAHATSFTFMHFSAAPAIARRQLCH